MSNRQVIIKFIAIMSVSLIVAAAAAGCTPESPPLPPLTGEGSETQSDAELSDGSSSETEQSRDISEPEKIETTAGSEISDEVTEPEISEEISVPERSEEITSGEPLWDESFGEAVTVNYQWFGEGDTIEAQTTNSRLITELREAVCAMTVGEETDHFVYDSNETLSFWNRTGNCLSFEFSGGALMKDGTHYELTGYDRLREIITELRENYSGENMEESFEPFTDQELQDMDTVGKRMNVLTNSDEYNNASLGERRKMTVAMLNELADEGLVIRESIWAGEDSDNVSFRYSCGVLGGVLLREWDPMMN